VDVLSALHPSKKLRHERKALKRCRRALGGWRDSEVMLGRVAQITQDAHGAERKRWSAVAAMLIRKRARQEREVVRHRLRIRTAARGLRTIIRCGSADLAQGVDTVMRNSWQKWNDAIEHALKDESVAALHAVRIKIKTLRYILETRRQLSPDSVPQAPIEWLKQLQDQLGAWHDEMNLTGAIAACFATRRLQADHDAQRLLNEAIRRESDGVAVCRRVLKTVEARREYRLIRERQGNNASEPS
ncbi:MAG: CHAD domain-containing protein, partial [Candidatus Binataceae bacterium]